MESTADIRVGSPWSARRNPNRRNPLDAQGRVVLAGPLTDKTGSLIVIEAESLADAEAFAREDPYTVNGVSERVEIHPFLQVFPKENCGR